MARWKAHGRLSIRVSWIFSLSITVPELWGEMCTAWLFSQRSTSLHSNFTWTGSSPINHSWHQKTTYTGLPDGEDSIPLRSVVLTQCRSVSACKTMLWRAVKRKKQLCRCGNFNMHYNWWQVETAPLNIRINFHSAKSSSVLVLVFLGLGSWYFGLGLGLDFHAIKFHLPFLCLWN